MSHCLFISRMFQHNKKQYSKTLCFLLSFLGFSVNAFALSVKEASTALKENNFTLAQEAFQKETVENEEDAKRALIAARASFELGDYESAASLFQLLATSNNAPEATKYTQELALFYQAESLFRALDRQAAKTVYQEFLDNYPQSGFSLRAQARISDCALALGQLSEALKGYQELRKKSANFLDQSQIRFSIANIQFLQEGSEKAKDEFLTIYLNYPATPAGKSSRKILEEISPGFLDSLRERERLQRDEALFDARVYEEACDDVKALLALQEKPSSRALYLMGRCHYQKRERVQAGKFFQQSAPKDPKRLWRAITSYTSASGKERKEGYQQARELIKEFLAKFPRHSIAKKARYKAAWLDYDEEKYRAAIKGFDAYLKKYPKDQDARWYAAWCYYLLGEKGKAIPYLSKLGKHSNALIGGQGRYWHARILQQQGKKKDARILYQEVVKKWPFTYYARVARARLSALGVSVSPFGDSGKHSPILDPIEEEKLSSSLETLVAKESMLDSTRFFLSIGFLEEAKDALHKKESALRKKYKKDALLFLCPLYLSIGDYQRSFSLAARSYGGELNKKPKKFSRLAWSWAYPRAYPKVSKEIAKEFSLDPSLLWTLMRKESGFAPWAVSYADALGLMQLLPKTGNKIAESLEKTQYRVADLFRPDTNIYFAAFYVNKLLKRFRGQTLLAAAAYNGGPSAVGRWLKEFGKRPLDEFVEEITYSQSRGYLKKVSGTYARYRYLYLGKDEPISLKIQAKNNASIVDY